MYAAIPMPCSALGLCTLLILQEKSAAAEKQRDKVLEDQSTCHDQLQSLQSQKKELAEQLSAIKVLTLHHCLVAYYVYIVL